MRDPVVPGDGRRPQSVVVSVEVEPMSRLCGLKPF